MPIKITLNSRLKASKKLFNELPRSRAARYQKEFLSTPMQSIEAFFLLK